MYVSEGKQKSHQLLLSHFSRVRLCATPQTAAHQAPPSLGFSRQEHWSGLPFPSPMHESASGACQGHDLLDPQAQLRPMRRVADADLTLDLRVTGQT